MYGRFWTPPHSRVPDAFIDSNRPHLTRDARRGRVMRRHVEQQRQQQESQPEQEEGQDERTLLLPTHVNQHSQQRHCALPTDAMTGEMMGYAWDRSNPLPEPVSPEIPGYNPHGRLQPSHPGQHSLENLHLADVKHEKHHGETHLRPLPPHVPDQDEHTSDPSARSGSERGYEKGPYNPRDRYGLPLYHSVPVSEPSHTEGWSGTGKWDANRKGWLILLCLALFVGTHTVHVVRSALYDIKERDEGAVQTQNALEMPMTFGAEMTKDGDMCVDLQGLGWSVAHPIHDHTNPTFDDGEGNEKGEEGTMWLANTHFTLPLNTPLFTLLRSNVRGDVGVRGTHASTGTETGEIDVLVEVKITSAAARLHHLGLQEAGAWSELKQYNLCRRTRSVHHKSSQSDTISETQGTAQGIDLRKITRAPEDHDDGISFSVQLLLPSADMAMDDAPLYVPELEIGVGKGDVMVDAPGVKFGEVRLWSRDGKVFVRECEADKLEGRTGRNGRLINA